MSKATTRINDLHKKANFTGEPHEQNEDQVNAATEAGQLSNDEADEFLTFLRALGEK